MNQTWHKPLSLTSDNPPLSEVTKLSVEGPGEALAPFLEASIAANTRRAYRSDVAHFRSWGGTIPSSPDELARYLADHATTRSIATLQRRAIAIGRAHTMLGLPDPARADLVRMTMRGIRRTYGRPQLQAAPAIKEDILAMVSGLNGGIREARDRALILIGFAGALRRSELVAINCSEIETSAHGLVLTISRSKTDQEGRGRTIGIPFAQGVVCPVRSLQRWMQMVNIVEGPIFRPINRHGQVLEGQISSEAVSDIVKARAKQAGLDPTRYSGHSLRAGFATSAAQAGVPQWKIKRQTGHKSDAMLARYIRRGELFRDNPVASLL